MKVQAVTTGSRQVDFKVSGLRCGGCAAGLTRKLSQKSGLADVAVNYGTMKLTASVLRNNISDTDIRDWVCDAGYDLKQKDITLKVEGMRCGGCASGLKRKLAKIQGLEVVNVNYADGRVSLKTFEDLSDEIEKVIIGAGYKIITNDPAGEGDVVPIFHEEVVFSLVASAYFMIPMIMAVLGEGHWHQHWAFNGWFQACLAAMVQFSIGRDFIKGAYRCIRSGIWTMDLLVFTGTSAAYGLSLWNLVHDPKPDLYFEASVVIVTFLLLGKSLEENSRKSAYNALNGLKELLPEWVQIKQDDSFVRASLADLKEGMIFRLRQGDRVPADALILQGQGAVDESILTGEALPIPKQFNDRLRAGTVLQEGLLIARAHAVGQSAALGQIASLIQEAQKGEHHYQRLADKISGIFVPIVFAIATATFFGWWGISGHWDSGVIASISVLVIACPCALGLAAPITIMNGLLAAARSGLLIRDFAAMERAALVDTIVFDKTGTLTTGEAKVVGEDWQNPADQQDPNIQTILASMVSQSSHPLAKALNQYLDKLEPREEVGAVRSIAGQGVSLDVAGEEWRLGRFDYVVKAAQDLSDDSYSHLYFGCEGSMFADFQLEDSVRSDSAGLVSALHDQGFKLAIMSGDKNQSVRALAEVLSIDHWLAEMTPTDKRDEINALQNEQGHKVLMVGDGVNDGPSLVQAYIGMSVAEGADIAKGAADVTLMRSGATPILGFLDIARKTRRKIKQNLGWAFVYNVIGIPIAVSGNLDPALAGVAMTLSSLSVVSNASLLQLWKAKA